MSKKPSKKISDKAWHELAEVAFNRLNDSIEMLSPDDPKFLGVIKEIFDRAYGKPTEKHEVGGKNGGPIVIKWQE